MRAFSIAPAFASLHAHAQLLTNGSASITVQSGVQLTVKGDVLNAAAGTVDNSGTIDLSGDWTNNAGNDCFGTSEGTVILNGTGQLIGGSSYTQFNHLQLTGGDVTLMQDAYVGGGAMTARTGVLALNGVKLLLNGRLLGLTNADPAAITRTSGFVVSETGPAPGYGRVNWFLGDHAPAFYTVPFGNASTNDYLPLDMNLLVAGSGTSGWYTFATYPTDPFALPNNRPLPSGMGSFTDLAGVENAQNVVDRFWIIDADEYATEPTVRFTFTYRDGEWNTGTNTIAEATLQAQRWDGAVWVNPPTGSVNTTTNTVGSLPVSDAGSVWVLVQGSTPLPVELLFFDARLEGDAVQCTWSTASEQNNDHFTVERSRDGSAFDAIGQVDGTGDSQQTLEYAFPDPAPYEGLSFYRLRQIDIDGTEQWSQAVPVFITHGGEGALNVWPNPCTTAMHLSGAGALDPIQLVDASGREVAEYPAGTERMDVSFLAPGSYTVVVRTIEGKRSARFLKE